MMHKILVVEDSQYKRDKIIDVISSNYSNCQVDICASFTSAWKHILSSDYKLIVLDMSIPTFDVSEAESGGEFRTFGGKELARKMARRKMVSKFIFITQYENFSVKNDSYTFESLKEEMFNEYPDCCLGFVLFSNKSSDWKNSLMDIVGAL